MNKLPKETMVNNFHKKSKGIKKSNSIKIKGENNESL